MRLAEALRAAPSRPFLVSVTNGLVNPLAGAADLALDTAAARARPVHDDVRRLAGGAGRCRAGAERWGRHRTGRRGRGRRRGRAASSIEAMLEGAEEMADRLAGWLEDRPVLALLGRGTARAASEMGALTLKEAARFPAESLEAAQFRTVRSSWPVPARRWPSSPPRRRPGTSISGWRPSCPGTGRRSWWSRPTARAPGRAAPRGPRPPDRPRRGDRSAALLSWRLAVDRGRDPGASTIASKVTTRE